MKILVFSSLNIDHDYHMDHICKEKETTFADSYQVVAGGKGLNAAIALAKSSAHVYLAGNIGNDATILQNVLDKYHVDCKYLNHVDEPNGHAIIQIDKTGENAIWIYGGSNQSISKEYIDKTIAEFEKGDLLILQNEINNNAYIIEQAHKKGLIIMLNPSPINNALKTYPLDLVDYFFLNEVEGNALTGESDFDSILDKFKQLYPNAKIIMTVGANGAYYQDEKQRVHQESFKVKAIDTVGAGDTFMGYFAYGLSQNKSVEQCLLLASKAASITVTRTGAADSIPTIDELNI